MLKEIILKKKQRLLTNIAEHTEITITRKAEGTPRRDRMTLTGKTG